MRHEELFYVTSEYVNYEIQILNGNNHFNIEREEPIKTEECSIYFVYLEKRMNYMKKIITPEQRNEMDNKMMECLGGIIESETGKLKKKGIL